MQQEHNPYHISTFSLGANTSDDKELMGVKEGSGEYIISRNARPVSTDGSTGSNQKIKGEELKWARNIIGSYRCIGDENINGNVFEVWASPVGGEDPFFRVN